jgi:hypothetical protein
LSPILFNQYNQQVTTEALKGSGNFKIGGKVICNMKRTNDLVVPSKEEAMLQGMINRLNENESCCGMEMNVEIIFNQCKVTRIIEMLFNNHTI